MSLATIDCYIDGLPYRELHNVEVLANDSIFVLVESTLDINKAGDGADEFLRTDAIDSDSDGLQQSVELVTLVKDAICLFAETNSTTGVVEALRVNSIETTLERALC